MTYLLGIDTGGTFTDAALLEAGTNDKGERVVATAKSLTTRNDFAIGIAAAAGKVVAEAGIDASQIAMVLNSMGMPPDSRIPLLTTLASSRR